MARGLYGQVESDAGVVNAGVERIADLVAEGHRTSDGNVTEDGYRHAMATAAAQDYEARRGEENVLRRSAPEIIKKIEIRGWQDDQRSALQRQADLAFEMRAAGFGLGNVYAALTVAPGIAGGVAQEARQARSKMFMGAPDRHDHTIKNAVRRKPSMYGLHHALVNADGSPIKDGSGNPIKV